jgi:O-antigen/teichoic acid export membrane protein
LPLLLISSALRGYLEAVGAFRELNLLRIPTGVMLVIAPCITALFSTHLTWACIGILLVRLIHVWILLYLVATLMQVKFSSFALRLVTSARSAWLKSLLTFGGWATVSNIVGPIIVYVDRFLIGSIFTASFVAMYAVPFDVVSRLPVLVAALCSVLLPELSRLSAFSGIPSKNATAMRSLVKRSNVLSCWVIAIIVAVCVTFTPWALRVWLGSEFAGQSTQTTQILLLAFGVNALAQIPFTALQAAGQVRSVAWLHVGELLPYAALLYVAISALGIEGAALAALLRSSIDYAALAWMWHRHSVDGVSSQSV